MNTARAAAGWRLRVLCISLLNEQDKPDHRVPKIVLDMANTKRLMLQEDEHCLRAWLHDTCGS